MRKDIHPPRRHRSPRPSCPATARVWLSLGLLLLATQCLACTSAAGGGSSGKTTDVPVEKREAPLGTLLSGGDWVVTGRGANYFSGCAADERVPIVTRISGDLTYVANIAYGGHTYAAYQMSPTSALIMFQHVTEIGAGTDGAMVETPVTDINETISPGIAPASGNTDKLRASYIRYRYVGRGSLMTTVSGKHFTIAMNPVNYPSLVSRRNSTQNVNVALPTCSFPDQTVRLDDIDATSLSSQGPSAYAKRFDVTMNCNLAGKSLRMSIRDATSTGNNGTELVPTADSTSQGVRLQLLRSGVPMAMNTSWTTPSVKGNLVLDMAARYYRTSGAFLSGSVGGKAMLTVEYQ